MRSEWKYEKLGDLASINKESYSKKEDWKYVNYLDTGNVTKGIIDEIVYIDLEKERLPSRARRKVSRNDIVYSTVRPNHEHYGIIKHPVSNMLVSTGFVTLSARDELDPFYLYYFLSQPNITDYLQAIAEQRVSTYPALHVSNVSNLSVSVPPLIAQRAIAATLSCLDTKIELNNKINENLEAQAQAMFKSWFVDFEPFQDGEFVESELGLIPEGWELRHFGDFVIPRVERDNNPLTPMYSVTNTGIHLRDRIFKKQLASSQTRNKVLRKGDLVFGMSREILNWGVMKDKIGEVSSAYHIYEIDQSVVESWYLELFMSQQIVYFSDLIRPASREGQGVDRDLLPRKLIYIPPSKWLNHYFDIWVSIKSAQGSNEVQNSTLKNIRDTLLPKLMSGEIEVPID